MCLGATAAASKQNFCQWIDLMIESMTTSNPLVTNANGARETGLYHKIVQPEFNTIIALLQRAFLDWGGGLPS